MLSRSYSRTSDIKAWPHALPQESLRTPNIYDVVIMTYVRVLVKVTLGMS